MTSSSTDIVSIQFPADTADESLNARLGNLISSSFSGCSALVPSGSLAAPGRLQWASETRRASVVRL